MGSRGRRGPLFFVLAAAVFLAFASPAAASLVFESKWGSTGTDPGQFQTPEGVATNAGGDVYVADSLNDRIQKFDANGAFLTAWGTYGTAGNGKFARPTGVATDFAGNVYVADSGNNRVQKFDSNGVFLTKWGTPGPGNGQFNSPYGVATDATGNVYVADSGNNRIQKFDAGGTFLLKWGTLGSGNSQFNSPTDVAVDASGSVYVTDSFNYRVKKFDSSGAFLTGWGSQGSANGEFNYPYGIEVDSNLGALVSDTNNHRVQRFTLAGAFVSATGSFGSADGQFKYPAGIGVGSGRAYVADSGNDRIQKFTVGGVIQVTKDAVPNDPQDFDFATGGGLSPASFQLDDDGDNFNELSNTRSFGVGAGSGYSVSETVPPGWDLQSATCSDGSPISNIDVSDAEVVTCTFTNQKHTQIRIVQDTQPDDPQDFDYTAGGGLSPTSFQLDDDGDNSNALSNTQVFDDLTPGSGYSVSQTTPGGWSAPEVTCSDGSPASNIDVSPAEIVTCTFANVTPDAGRITVVKDAQPNDPQDFDFTAGGGLSPTSFQLDDDGDNSNTLSNQRSFIVAPGSGYSLSESVPSGWSLSSATCSDGSPISNVDVSGGEFVTCTFTNRKHGTLVVVKNSQPKNIQDFDFTAGGGLSPSSFQLDDDFDATLSNTRTFTGVPAGAGYSLSETVPAGWEQLSATCSDGSPVSNIDVGPAETVTCTFVNRKFAQIVVLKDAQPDDPQDFDFTAGGGLSPTSFQLDDDGDNSNALPIARAFTGLTPGSGYSVGESTPAGWFLSSATCNDGSPPSNITLSAGENVICTFVNQKRGSITIVEDTRPDGPQDFSYTTTGGLSPNSFQLDDDGDNSNTLSNTRTYTNVSPGSYGINQAAVPGWLVEESSCSDGSPASNIALSAGENVTCTFGNSQKGRIIVRKDAQPDNHQDFDFTAGGGLNPSSFQLDDDTNPTLSNTRAFIVDPGSGYSVSEATPPAPWTLASATCSDGSPIANIDVAQAETVTCTFVNHGQIGDYPRPKGATPLRAALVPAYNPCTTPNRTHGPPLAFPSCNPPVQASTAVTIGSPDANGAAANFEGRVRYDVRWFPGGVDDTDVSIEAFIQDARCKPGTTSCGNANAADGSDYTGQLQATTVLRITDAASGDAATVVDIPLSATIPCANTASTAIGGQCSVNTSVDTLIPGAVPEGSRVIWQMGQVQVSDGGPDGDITTAPNTLFMVQGTFTP